MINYNEIQISENWSLITKLYYFIGLSCGHSVFYSIQLNANSSCHSPLICRSVGFSAVLLVPSVAPPGPAARRRLSDRVPARLALGVRPRSKDCMCWLEFQSSRDLWPVKIQQYIIDHQRNIIHSFNIYKTNYIYHIRLYIKCFPL